MFYGYKQNVCQRFSTRLLFILFLIFAHLWWFRGEVLGLGSRIGFLRLGFSADGVWGLCYVAFWVFWGCWAFYINIEENFAGVSA